MQLLSASRATYLFLHPVPSAPNIARDGILLEAAKLSLPCNHGQDMADL